MDGVDLPLRTADADQKSAFRVGDSLFGTPFPAVDGLGPLYIRDNCESCHQGGGRGPGNVQKVAWVEADGVTPSAAMSFGNTLRPYSTDAYASPLIAPTDPPTPDELLKLTTRMPAAVLGRGYLEAIDDAEIVRLESEQAARTDAIHGRINRVVYRSTESADPQFHQFVLGQTSLIGRFGLKARQPTLDDFTADALAGDMGITSPQPPSEPANPAGVTDDAKSGQDVTVDVVRKISAYVRLIEIPVRAPAPDTPQARALFDQALCSACHTPSLRTRSDYPIAQLAGIAAPVFTDMLLHAMGTDLAAMACSTNRPTRTSGERLRWLACASSVRTCTMVAQPTSQTPSSCTMGRARKQASRWRGSGPSATIFALGGIGTPALQALATKQVDKGQQGQFQGVLASLLSLSAIIGPLFFSSVYFMVQKEWPGAIWLSNVLLSLAVVPVVLSLRLTKAASHGVTESTPCDTRAVS
jgi:hypothetical protein